MDSHIQSTINKNLYCIRNLTLMHIYFDMKFVIFLQIEDYFWTNLVCCLFRHSINRDLLIFVNYCIDLLNPSAQNQQTVVRLAKRRQTKGLRKNLVFILIHIPPSKMRTRIVGCQRGMEIETYSNSFLANKTKRAKRNIYEIRKENQKDGETVRQEIVI